MKLYADRVGTRARQFFTDLFVIAWVYLWVMLAMRLYDLVEKLAVPGKKLEGAGGGLAENLRGAGTQVDRVPGVGDDIAAPFNRAAEAAGALADAGREQQDIVHDLAMVLALITAAVPIAMVVLIWLPLRVRWVRRASSAKKITNAKTGRDLLALRALATQPLNKLAALDPDIAGAWRRGDPAAVAKLAELELKGLGLR